MAVNRKSSIANSQQNGGRWSRIINDKVITGRKPAKKLSKAAKKKLRKRNIHVAD